MKTKPKSNARRAKSLAEFDRVDRQIKALGQRLQGEYKRYESKRIAAQNTRKRALDKATATHKRLTEAIEKTYNATAAKTEASYDAVSASISEQLPSLNRRRQFLANEINQQLMS